MRSVITFKKATVQAIITSRGLDATWMGLGGNYKRSGTQEVPGRSILLPVFVLWSRVPVEIYTTSMPSVGQATNETLGGNNKQ